MRWTTVSWAVALAPLVAGSAAARLAELRVDGLRPAFDPAVTAYTAPRTGACSVPVSATVANPAHRLYVASTETASGATRNAWVCDGRTGFSVVVYEGWREVSRYTVTMVEAPPPPPPVDAPLPPVDAPLPPIEPVDALTAERLLQQATFGPTAADMATVQALGAARWLAEQRRVPASPVPDGLDNNRLRARVFLNMAHGPDQLRQRMAFALGQILVVSTSKNVNGYELIPWVRLLSDHAFGNYRDLLREVTLSPTMGKFLDLANSTRAMDGGAPNENYPRELMQLFTIGLWALNPDGAYVTDARGELVPTYDQQTVREVARALTGWTYPTAPGQTPRSRNPEHFAGRMEPRPQLHDTGAKTLFPGVTLPAGQTVEQDLEGVIDALFHHPNTAPFVATRLIRSLVTSNPSPGYVARIAAVFADRGDGVRGDLGAVLVALLTDDEAALEGADDGRLKDPVLHVIGLARALGVEIGDPGLFMYVMADLGQAVLSPATVFGFYPPLGPLPGRPDLYGPEFQIYTPALAVQRANFTYALLNGDFRSAFPVDLAPFVALAGDPDALVDHVDAVLLFGRMSPALRDVLVEAAASVSDPRQRALGALYLAAISSELAVHTGF